MGGHRRRGNLRAIRTAYDAGINAFDTRSPTAGGTPNESSGRPGPCSGSGHPGNKGRLPSSAVRPGGQGVPSLPREPENRLIDLYQIHWPAGSFKSKIVPIEETMRAMNDLTEQGKIRAIGVSNFSRAQLEEACRLRPDREPPAALLAFLEARRRGCDALSAGRMTSPCSPIRPWPRGCSLANSARATSLVRVTTVGRTGSFVRSTQNGCTKRSKRFVRSLRAAGSRWASSHSLGSSHNPVACAIAGARNADGPGECEGGRSSTRRARSGPDGTRWGEGHGSPGQGPGPVEILHPDLEPVKNLKGHFEPFRPVFAPISQTDAQLMSRFLSGVRLRIGPTE